MDEEQPTEPDAAPGAAARTTGPREVISSWLSGPRAAAEDEGVPFGYRGQRLGYPEAGPGSVATMGRRVAAIVVDWLACYLVAWAVVAWTRRAAADIAEVRLWNSVLFFVEVWLLTSLGGGSFGQRLTGLQVQRVHRGRLGSLRCLVRTALIMLVVPPLIWDRDGRGLHDKAVDSVVVRARA